jgi:hypothetical protein
VEEQREIGNFDEQAAAGVNGEGSVKSTDVIFDNYMNNEDI